MNTLLEAMEQNNPDGVRDSFLLLITAKIKTKLAEKYYEISSTLLESDNSDIDEAVESVIDELAEQDNLDNIDEIIQNIAEAFNISEDILREALENAFKDQDDSIEGSKPKEAEEVNESVLEILTNIAEGTESSVVTFANNTSTILSPEDALQILELWSKLNEEKQEILINTLCESKTSFDKVLEFCTEDIHIKSGHKGLLHKDLGIPEGEPIPDSKLEAALHSSDPDVRKRAIFAKNAKKWH
jgi:hypothetical protein